MTPTPPHASDDAPPEVEPIRWKLKGIGMYGSDVEVVAAESYDALKRQYDSLLQALANRYAAEQEEAPGD